MPGPYKIHNVYALREDVHPIAQFCALDPAWAAYKYAQSKYGPLATIQPVPERPDEFQIHLPEGPVGALPASQAVKIQKAREHGYQQVVYVKKYEKENT